MGVIYFITQEDDRYVKIGYADKDANRRLLDLQIGNPHELYLYAFIDGDIALEKELHERFKKFHIRGEWFQFKLPIRQYITYSSQERRKRIREELATRYESMTLEELDEFIKKHDM